MFKFLEFIFFVFIGFYFLSKIIGVLFRTLLAQNHVNRPSQPGSAKRKKASNGAINVEYVPDENHGKKGYTGGEYVDYEEVK